MDDDEARMTEPSTTRGPMTDPFANLAPRELELCALIAEGCTRKHCSVMMRVTVHTVDTYLERIADKLPKPQHDDPPRTRIQHIAHLYRHRYQQAA